MKYKIVWCSIIFLIIVILSRNLFNSKARKCAPYREWKLEITLGHREMCLRSVEKSKDTQATDWSKLTTLEEIRLRGYIASSYSILSKDGYYTTIYRISGRQAIPHKKGKHSMLLFHGGGASGASWIIQPGSRNLAFTLVDAGFEVWLANARGTTASKNHTHLDADKDLDYWKFSIEEIGTRDLPLIVDLILQETGTEKVYYACQSMGCGVYFSGLSEIPELNTKFEAGFLMAPMAYDGSAYSLLFRLLSPIIGTPFEDFLFYLLGGQISAEPSSLAKALGLTPYRICSWPAFRCGICDNFLFLMYGDNASQLNYTDLPNTLRKLQDNMALRTLFHGIQSDLQCDFRKYDHGTKENIEKYGSPEPPRYNLKRIRVPTFIFYGESDNFFTPSNAEKTKEAISPQFMKGFHKVDWPLFNHIDFLMAKDADILVYHKIRDIIIELESKKEIK